MSRMQKQIGHREAQQSSLSVGDCERLLRQAAQILAPHGKPRFEDWLLVASNLGQVRNHLRVLPPGSGMNERALLDQVVATLKEITGDFSDADFLRATRAARRKAPGLFPTNP
mgnify:CR=1 FL=1